MPVTSYYSINGNLVGERTASGRTDYLSDALGSVTATAGSSGAVGNRYRYKPYGSQLSKTGADLDPKFRWIGQWGYRSTSIVNVSHYVRARHYGSGVGAFTTRDPFSPRVSPFSYVHGRVATYVDPSGLYIHGIGCNDPTDKDRFEDACKKLRDCLNKRRCKEALLECIGRVEPPGWVERVLREMANRCLSKENRICVVCGKNNLPKACEDICDRSSVSGETVRYKQTKGLFDKDVRDRDIREPINECKLPFPCDEEMRSDNRFKDCECIIVLCHKDKGTFTFLHELVHCVGVAGEWEHGRGKDVVYRIEDCIRKKVKPF